MFHTKGIKRR